MRCLTLGAALRDRGADVSFVCREMDGDLNELIESREFTVARLPVGKSAIRLDPSEWERDAKDTMAALGSSGGRPQWLIVDHYALDARWESALRKSSERTMVIDDLADRQHDCDLLLDQNLFANMDGRYLKRVPGGCSMLLGPEYALLQPEYSELHSRIRPREGKVNRILITFGGADEDNLTGRALSAFLALRRDEIECDVVFNESGIHGDAIRAQAAGRKNVHLHSDLPTLAPLIADADLAVGGAGATSWERLCLGLPSLTVILAENQRVVGEELGSLGLARVLGDKTEVTEAVIAKALGDLIATGLEKNWSERCLSTVDGNGAKRVCAALMVSSSDKLTARRAATSDESLLLAWANDPMTRSNAFSQQPISVEDHHSWLASRLDDESGCRLYVVQDSDGVPIGQVRFERKDARWQIDYALAPVFRGRGLGKPLLEAALAALRKEFKSATVFAQVKSENRSSQKVFESLGFDRVGEGGSIEYQRVI
jgi:UDP-2,4-diacetamido-2,4,6-trideoxy-beta-L-altropyranose hydrolase